MSVHLSASRREFLKQSAGLAVGWGLACCSSRPVGAAEATRKIPIGLQLYAVRGAFAKEVPGTLAEAAEIGYRGVEFWGYGGTPNVYQQYSAPQLRKLLDQNRIACCGMHLQVKALDTDHFGRTVENNRILGNQNLIVAAAKEKMATEESIKAFAEELTVTADLCGKEGMRVGYHAHPFDFARIGGRTAWEILFSHAGPEVVMQMDVGNCLGGGGDPIAMLKQFPGRAKTVHIKEYEEKTFDSDYYKQVFRLCETSGGTQWYIVEMGDPGGNGLNVPRSALRKLHRLGH